MYTVVWSSGCECRQHVVSLFVSECSSRTLRHQQGKPVVCVKGSSLLIACELAWLVVGVPHRVVDSGIAVHLTTGSAANCAEAVSVTLTSTDTLAGVLLFVVTPDDQDCHSALQQIQHIQCHSHLVITLCQASRLWLCLGCLLHSLVLRLPDSAGPMAAARAGQSTYGVWCVGQSAWRQLLGIDAASVS